MKRLPAMVLTALAAGTALSACSYDLDRLRGDAALDMRVPDADDAPDVPDKLDGFDGSDGLDVPDVRDDGDELNVCTSRPAPTATEIGTRIGGSLVIAGDTLGAPSRLTPPTLGPDCPLDYSSPSPERVYRYVVEEGPTLYATTDAPPCAGIYDTIVYVRTSCEGDRGTTLACNDDDRVLSGCGCTDACPGLASGTMVEGLRPGQVVYVVVDGYGGRAGRFRLSLTENAARHVPPPGTSASYALADRCGCPGATDATVDALSFPAPGDTVVGSSSSVLSQPGDRLTGLRRLPFWRIAGVALETQLERNDLLQDTRCVDTRALVDLLIDNVVVHSFEVTPRTRTDRPLRVAYQGFAPRLVTTSSPVAISLRLREILPSGCGSIQFARTAPGGTLTLLGGT
jgi:hypothetical protein